MFIDARILKSKKSLSGRVPTNFTNNLKLIGKPGDDDSTGQSEYKTRFSDTSCLDDGRLFVTSYVSLQLVVNSPW